MQFFRIEDDFLSVAPEYQRAPTLEPSGVTNTRTPAGRAQHEPDFVSNRNGIADIEVRR